MILLDYDYTLDYRSPYTLPITIYTYIYDPLFKTFYMHSISFVTLRVTYNIHRYRYNNPFVRIIHYGYNN